jgi:hypothetical protein
VMIVHEDLVIEAVEIEMVGVEEIWVVSQA